MVEEMYKEETGDAEMDSNSSSENAVKATKGDNKTSEDRGGDLQQTASSTATERCSTGQLMDTKPDHVPDVEMPGSTGLLSFQNGTRRVAENEYVLVKRREEQRPSVDDCSLFPDGMVLSDAASERFMAATAAYHMSELGRFGGVGVECLYVGVTAL